MVFFATIFALLKMNPEYGEDEDDIKDNDNQIELEVVEQNQADVNGKYRNK